MAEVVVASRLRSFIERVEKLNEEIDALTADRKEIFEEAKGQGFDVKVLRKVIARRKKEKADIQEEDAILEMYESAISG